MPNNNDLNDITVNEESLQKYLYKKEVEKEDKNIQRTHAEQTKAPARLPIGKPKYTPRAEPPGKCKHLTPKEIEMDYRPPNSYKTNQRKVIATLLSAEKSLAFIDFAILLQSADRSSLSAILSQISTALESYDMPIKIASPGGNVYSLTEKARIKTVDEMDEMVKAYWRKKRKKYTSKPTPKLSKEAKATLDARIAKKVAADIAKANAGGPEPKQDIKIVNKVGWEEPKPTDDGTKQEVPPKETLGSIKAQLDSLKAQLKPEKKPTKDQLPHPFSYPQIISEIGEAINNVPEGITVRFIVEIKG